ncbi:MAG TPA: hypothetical protein VHI52_07020 [Verrucomicrobiae bacterium]|nr:hypothetical protein [Verrucomicrobiae bacterium]
MKTPNHILLVESDPDDARLLKAAFDAARIMNPIEVATSERAAMDYFRPDGAPLEPSRLPALTILALRLPILNNFRLLRWIRSQPELREISLFVLAGVGLSEEDTKAHELGSDCYGEKPADFSGTVQLVKMLEQKFLNPHVGHCGGGR